ASITDHDDHDDSTTTPSSRNMRPLYHHDFRRSHSHTARRIASSRRETTTLVFCDFKRALIASRDRSTRESRPRCSRREIYCQALSCANDTSCRSLLRPLRALDLQPARVSPSALFVRCTSFAPAWIALACWASVSSSKA